MDWQSSGAIESIFNGPLIQRSTDAMLRRKEGDEFESGRSVEEINGGSSLMINPGMIGDQADF